VVNIPKPTGPSDIRVRKLITRLKKLSKETGKGIWRRVAEDLLKPRRNRAEVPLHKIEKYVNDGDVVVVPGKVLSNGELTKKVTIIALSTSKEALEKIKKSGSEFISLYDVTGQEIQGKRTWIMR